MLDRRYLLAAGAATLLCFPFVAVVPGPGTDPSWQAGLVMARQQGLRFGHDVVFTYGPLGFLTHPQLWGTPSLLAIALTLVVLSAQTFLGTHWIRQHVPLPVAALAAGLGTNVAWRYEPTVATPLAYLLCAATFAFLLRTEPPTLRRGALTGLAAGLLLLTKTDLGTLGVCCAAAVVVAGWQHERRRDTVRVLAATSGALLGSLLIGWLLAGQRISDFVPWLRNAAEVASGFNEAMVYRAAPFGPALAFAATAVFLAALSLAVRRIPTRRRRAAAPAVLFAGVVVWLGAKSGFVRYDAHAYRYLWLLVVLGLATLPSANLRSATLRSANHQQPKQRRALPRTALPTALSLATIALLLLAHLPADAGNTSLLQLWRGPRNVWRLAQPLVSSDARSRITAAGTRAVLASAPLPRTIADAITAKRVHVESDDIATVWAFGKATWDPNPVFQSYSAYTARLDGLNAAHYADAKRGPEVVLYRSGSGDGHHPRFTSPAAITALLCNFDVTDTTDPVWQLLVRVPTRCGRARRAGTVSGSVGTPLVWTPTPADDRSIVVGRFVLHRPLTERVSALLRVRPRTWTFTLGASDNDTIYRFDPATAAQPHLLAVPSCLRNRLGRIDARTYQSIELGLSDSPPTIPVELQIERIPYRCP